VGAIASDGMIDNGGEGKSVVVVKSMGLPCRLPRSYNTSMTADALFARLRRRRFVPFRVILSRLMNRAS
jgi:hypothetical protein